MTFEELCYAVYYAAVFAIYWGKDKHRINTARARGRWLQRHMIDRERMDRITGGDGFLR